MISSLVGFVLKKKFKSDSCASQLKTKVLLLNLGPCLKKPKIFCVHMNEAGTKECLTRLLDLKTSIVFFVLLVDA